MQAVNQEHKTHRIKKNTKLSKTKPEVFKCIRFEKNKQASTQTNLTKHNGMPAVRGCNANRTKTTFGASDAKQIVVFEFTFHQAVFNKVRSAVAPPGPRRVD